MGAFELVKALGGDWHGSYGLVPGPGHSPKDRSVCIINGENGEIIIHSHAGEDWRKIKDALRRSGLLCETVTELTCPRPRQLKPAPPPADLSLWSRTRTITAEDLAGQYLAGRGCAIPPPDGDLRWCDSTYHWPSRQSWPALISLITDAITGMPMGIHQTFLASNGSGKAPVTDPRLYPRGHSKKGGVVRLWPDSEVNLGLAIGEGIETCLTAARGFTPVWAALDAGNIKNFPVLTGIEALTILADNDVAGINAAETCADRWNFAGREVRVWSFGHGR